MNSQILRAKFAAEILLNSPDGIFIADSTGRYKDVNPSACEITGYTYEELTNLKLFEIIHTDSLEAVDRSFENLKQAGRISDEFKFVKKDGTIYYMQVDAVKFDDDTYLGFCKDTTKLKLNERACEELAVRMELEAELVDQKRQMEARYRQMEAIMESMSDGLFMIDRNYKFTFLNQGGYDFFYKPETLESAAVFKYSKYYDMKGKALTIDEMIGTRVLKGEKIKYEKIKAVRPDKTLYFSMSGNPVLDDNGDIAAAIICCRDITEQVGNEELIYMQNEALKRAIEMKDEFLSIISHEFKTPLAVINSAIQTIELTSRDDMSPKVKSFIKVIRQNAFRQLRLVNNLLDITRANAGRIKLNKTNIDIVFLTKSIVESVGVYAQQKGLEIEYISEMKLKYIYLDEEKYERILLNLISNAIKFTPKGNSITVRLSRKRVRNAGRICIQVIDTGVGIPKDKQNLIFEKFGQVDSSLTRRAEGTGIGLSLVKKFIEAHEGEISVESEPGKGSIFTVLLPITKGHERTEEKKLPELMDNRLIQSVAIEFSDIYF